MMPATDDIAETKLQLIKEPLLGPRLDNDARLAFPIFILSVATTVACLDHFYYTNQEGKQLIDISVHIIIFLGCFLFSRHQQDVVFTELIPKTMFGAFLVLLCLGFVDLASVLLSLTSLAMTIIVIVVNTWGLLAATPPEDDAATVDSEVPSGYNNVDLLVV